jgi:hypothetical protein
MSRDVYLGIYRTYIMKWPPEVNIINLRVDVRRKERREFIGSIITVRANYTPIIITYLAIPRVDNTRPRDIAMFLTDHFTSNHLERPKHNTMRIF